MESLSRTKTFSDLQIHDVFQFERVISQKDIQNFCTLSGDLNPMHLDPAVAKQRGFKTVLVPGMLSASFFSKIIGMFCPAKNGIYLSQNSSFKKPIYPNEKISIKATVTHKSNGLKLVTLKTEIWVNKELRIDGEAKVQFF